MNTYYAFIAHPNVAEYEAVGWEFQGASPGAHGFYSATMKWTGAGEPPCPRKIEAIARACVLEGEGVA